MAECLVCDVCGRHANEFKGSFFVIDSKDNNFVRISREDWCPACYAELLKFIQAEKQKHGRN